MNRWIDLIVVAVYLGFMAALGMHFSRRQTSIETYFVGKRSVPGWALGMSMLATMISSVTFVAYPGSSYAGNWSLLVPGFLILATLPLVAKVVIPFYREAVGVSAYEYFQKRFGLPARLYASAAFSLAHFSKMGFVLYLMALTISSMTGWNITAVIVTAAVIMVFYTVVGGIEAVVWADVVQGFVLWIGVGIALGFLLFLPAGGPAAVFSVAMQNGKFSLGDFSWDWSRPTIPVAILYGLFWYGQRYVADQTLVQRYLLAKSDRAALRGVSLGALLCVPVWALFMLVGTCVWSFFKLGGGTIPKTITKADQMFPYFLSTQLPHGILGLLLAALTGAAMTMLASDLNSLASVATEDFYRAARPGATDRERLRAAKTIVIIMGLLNAVTALALVHSKGSVLSMWFAVSAIASGGLGGLFLLAFLLPRATRAAVYAGIVASMLFTIWAVLTKGPKPMVSIAPFNFPFDELTIGALGNIILFAIGAAVSLMAAAKSAGKTTDTDEGTLWYWLRTRETGHATSGLAQRSRAS
jgi:SSS family solute:Na+ symporter